MTKARIVILTLCLAALVAASPCMEKNPLIKLLTPAVTVFNAPRFTPLKTCGGLWYAHGTCCDLGSLKAWKKNDSARIRSNSESFKSQYRSILLSLKANFIAIKREMRFRFRHAVRLSWKLSTQYQANVNASLDKCTKFTIKSRSSALCYVCSGNSAQYFTREKAAVSPRECGKMVGACEDFLKYSFDLVKEISKVAKVIMEIKEKESVDSTSGMTSTISLLDTKSDILRAMVSKKVVRTLRYSFSRENPFKTEICDAFFNLVKDPFVDEIGPILQTLQANFEDLVRKASLEGPSNSVRGLELEDWDSEKAEAANLFDADSKVVEESLSNFRHRENDIGVAPSFNELSWVTPMNLTMKFP